MKDEKNWVVVGRFGRPHGLKGYISVYSFTQPVSNILKYANWVVLLRGNQIPIKVIGYVEHTKFITVMIEGYQDRDLVSQLTNLDIEIKVDELPRLESGEYYWHQLIGMTVVNTHGETLGKVTEMLATGSNDVLVVVGDSRFLIPYRPGVVVLDVSDEKHQITVDWDNEFL